jgi:hypothetical protein
MIRRYEHKVRASSILHMKRRKCGTSFASHLPTASYGFQRKHNTGGSGLGPVKEPPLAGNFKVSFALATSLRVATVYLPRWRRLTDRRLKKGGIFRRRKSANFADRFFTFRMTRLRATTIVRVRFGIELPDTIKITSCMGGKIGQ